MAKDEGARSFALILGQCEDGQLHAELSEKLQALNANLSKHAESFGKAKGEIVLSLKLSVDQLGTTQIEADIKIKEPKVVRPRSVFWLNSSNNLLNENPRQTKLPLREVPLSKDAARDVGAEHRDAKGV